jgi:hypothetical protein
MTSLSRIVQFEVDVPFLMTERTFLQLAVQAATKKFREIQVQGSAFSEPPCSGLTQAVPRTD